MSIFADDWRDCLREQYKYVVKNNDNLTKESLTGVLQSVGFSENELAELGVQATMHVDDVPEDFQPDLNILNVAAEQGFVPHPAECQCPSCVEVNLLPHDEDGQPIEMEEEELVDRIQHAMENDNDDDVAQLSLF